MAKKSFLLSGVLSISTVMSCGGSASPAAPSPRTEQLTATITGTLASQDWVCFPVSDLAGQFTASVAPEVPIEFSTGDCNSPATPPLAHGDRGYVTATLPEGTKRVRIYNPSTGFPSFQLAITYPIAL
jgi:hypothetical protein